jgi:uncharacterized protein YegJ (DUF2314 family)
MGMKRAINWLTTNRMLAVLWLALLGWIWGYVSAVMGVPWAWVVVVACVAGITGLLLRQEWGCWLAIVLLALGAANATATLVTKGWKLNRFVIAISTAFVAWGLWRKPDEGFFDDDGEDKDHGESEKDDETSEPSTLISLVLLRSSQRYLEPLILAHALSDAWGLKLRVHDNEDADDGNENDDSDGFVTEMPAGFPQPGPVFMVFVSRPSTAFFLVHSHEGNYFDEPETVAADIPNLRFADAVRHHHAWLSVDLLEKSSSAVPSEDVYRWIGKAIVALADDATLALLCPQHQYFNLWSEALEEQLCSPDPLSAFQREVKAPIVGVSDESGIRDAIAEARQRWPEFVAAFQRRQKEGPPFIVKAPFITDDHTEHMWLEVFALEPEYVHGHLVNDPFYHPRLKKGSQVEVPVGEITDWVFAENEKAVGNFTGRAVNEARQPGKE